MNTEQEFERTFRAEFKELVSNVIFKDDDGIYNLFGKYRIVPEKHQYRVFCHATEVGTFNSTRTALSWCIADKYQNYTLARDLQATDAKLTHLSNDISARAAVGDQSKNPLFRESILTKLETKIIHKKQLENQLTNCVNWAKYIQQRGFNNETVRTGRNQAVKTSR